MVIVNLFAFRGTNPKVLSTSDDPVGPHNDRALELLTATALHTVATWGGKGALDGRSKTVRPFLHDPLCLGATAQGAPRHPLYVGADVPAVPLP